MKNRSSKLKDKIKPQANITIQKKCCANCLKGKHLGFNNDILCLDKGIVSADYCCSSHRFFGLDDLNKVNTFHCSDCEFFVFHPHESIENYGVCDLFSVRKCDGSIKKACSKFVYRREHIA